LRQIRKRGGEGITGNHVPDNRDQKSHHRIPVAAFYYINQSSKVKPSILTEEVENSGLAIWSKP